MHLNSRPLPGGAYETHALGLGSGVCDLSFRTATTPDQFAAIFNSPNIPRGQAPAADAAGHKSAAPARPLGLRSRTADSRQAPSRASLGEHGDRSQDRCQISDAYGVGGYGNATRPRPPYRTIVCGPSKGGRQDQDSRTGIGTEAVACKAT